MERCTQDVQQQGQVVVEGQGLRTRVMRCVLVWEPLSQRGRACGTGTRARRLVFLVHGRIGCAFQVMQHLKEGAKRMAILRHPPGHVARGPGAGPQAQTALGGHAKAAAISAAPCARQVSAARSAASSMVRLAVLAASRVTQRGAWRAKISSLRYNTHVCDGIKRVEGSA